MDLDLDLMKSYGLNSIPVPLRYWLKEDLKAGLSTQISLQRSLPNRAPTSTSTCMGRQGRSGRIRSVLVR